MKIKVVYGTKKYLNIEKPFNNTYKTEESTVQDEFPTIPPSW